MYESFQWFTETIDYESKSIPQLSNAEFGLNPISAIKALKYRIVMIMGDPDLRIVSMIGKMSMILRCLDKVK